jgi:hypothetical protein
MSEFLRRARIEAMLAAFSSGTTSTEELSKAAKSAERKITDQKGLDSVKKFLTLSKKIAEIDYVRPATQKEDREWHTDMWIILKNPVAGRRLLPLEIKSSKTGVNEFKNSSDFKRNPFCIVINSNMRRKDNSIITDFRRELERVSAELNARRRY